MKKGGQGPRGLLLQKMSVDGLWCFSRVLTLTSRWVLWWWHSQCFFFFFFPQCFFTVSFSIQRYLGMIIRKCNHRLHLCLLEMTCCESLFQPKWWHFFLSCYPSVCRHMLSVVSDSLWPYRLEPTKLLCPWGSPGKNTRVGCHFLLQGIFPTPELNLRLMHLLHWKADFLLLSHQGSPMLYQWEGLYLLLSIELD